ncbi:hypothetical protein PJI16_16170 [Nitrospira sp. MA-1]|nr:hypothetical protein [Nitrospira sp. MA-1]
MMAEDTASNSPPKSDFERRLTKGIDLSVPDDIAGWLGRGLLLYGVPFNYLVPDERMLPPESIRFFYLDQAWVQCLLEGAVSVGRGTERDEMVDQELSNSFLARASEAGASLRDRGRADSDDDEAKASELTKLNWPLTGFLLRSSVVAGWQGLEVVASEGFDSTIEKPIGVLKALRIDRLGPDVLLCLYNGVIKFIEVRQPLEGLHFGASPTPKGGFQKLSVRRVNAPAGEQLPGPKAKVKKGDALDVPMRPGVNRVVKVKELAENLEKKLKGMGAMDKEGEYSLFTAAEFGLQMVESPGRVRFEAAGMKKNERKS